MIWTKKENDIREIKNMLNYSGETCKDCQWCNHSDGNNFFTCGHHLENFTPSSWCSYWTSKTDPKVKKYLEKRKKVIHINTRVKGY